MDNQRCQRIGPFCDLPDGHDGIHKVDLGKLPVPAALRLLYEEQAREAAANTIDMVFHSTLWVAVRDALDGSADPRQAILRKLEQFAELREIEARDRRL